jgi:vacuolar-type H+-ATPase subunit E/Vma4
MALADLISRLEQEAQAQADAIQRDADAEVRAIREEAEQAAAEATARHLEHERAARHLASQRELARVRREARARELAARHAQLARILERARALLPEVAASTRYLEVLPSHAEEALSFVEGLRPRVRCQRRFAPALQGIVARHEGAQLVIDEAVGPGVIAEAADGSVVVDNTLAARLARAETRLAIELLKRISNAGG